MYVRMYVCICMCKRILMRVFVCAYIALFVYNW